MMHTVRHARVLGVTALLSSGCPTDKPVLPALSETTTSATSTSTGSSSGADGSTSTSSSGTTGITGTTDTTGSTSTGPSESSSGGLPVCELPGDSCAPPTPRTPWWNPAWSHRRAIAIASPLGDPLTDAVVPVRLDADFEFGCAQPNGDDLRFVDDAGDVFPHELDQWEPEVGGVAWVRVSALAPAGQALWLYYGNERAPEPAGEIWPSSLGLQAVLHMGGDLEDARGMHPGQPAVNGAIPQYAPDGVWGRAVHYEGILANARAELEGSSFIDDAMSTNEAMTATAWVRSTPSVQSPSAFRAVISRGTDYWSMLVQDVEGDWDFIPPAYPLFFSRCAAVACDALVDGFDNHFLTGTTPVIEDPVTPAWHHMAVVYESLGGGSYAKRLYVDGQPDGELVGSLLFPWESTPFDGSPITIGAGPTDAPSSVFHGEIDEVHIASAAWSADRIEAEYAYADPSLVSVSSAECI